MGIFNRKEFPCGIRKWHLRWRHLLSVTFIFYVFFMLRRNQFLSLENNYPYSQGGLDLPTFFTPFTCDPKTLPQRVRMVRREHEDYVLLEHGFKDFVSDYNWNAKGDDGWEDGLTRQMELYLKAIKALEPSRASFIDLGANIGTHLLHLASRGYETHGFEPTYANYVLTHCSLALSGIAGPVRFNHFGLGDKVQSVCMDSVSWNMGDTRVNASRQCEATNRAKMDTLDNYYRTFLRGRKVALLKIDIQGFEIPALRHGTGLFDSNDAPEVVMLEYEPIRIRAEGYDPPELIRYFEERDYSIWHFGKAPFGIITPDYVNGTSVAWKESDLHAFDNAEGGSGYFDLVAIKRPWQAKAKNAGYKFTGGTLLKS
jgi:FkbM family methyltransferase